MCKSHLRLLLILIFHQQLLQQLAFWFFFFLAVLGLRCCMWAFSTWGVHVQSLSHVQLFATPWMVAYQAPFPMGFPWQDTGVGCHFLLQGIFLTQESLALCLLPCVSCIGRWMLYHWAAWDALSRVYSLVAACWLFVAWLLSLQSTGPRVHGLSSCGAWV